MIIKQQDGIHLSKSPDVVSIINILYTSTLKWVENFFNNQLACSERMKTTSSVDVLLVERPYEDERRTFAVCFGYGRSLLVPANIEERFGLITTLRTGMASTC